MHFITLTMAIHTDPIPRTSLGAIVYCVVSSEPFKIVVSVTVKIDKHLQGEKFLDSEDKPNLTFPTIHKHPFLIIPFIYLLQQIVQNSIPRTVLFMSTIKGFNWS